MASFLVPPPVQLIECLLPCIPHSNDLRRIKNDLEFQKKKIEKAAKTTDPWNIEDWEKLKLNTLDDLRSLTAPRSNLVALETENPFAAMMAEIDQVNLYNQRNNPSTNSSNYFQALLAINPHNRTPKQRYDFEQRNPRQTPMRMNDNNAVVNGSEDLQNIYGKNRQPNKAYCYKFQDGTCTWVTIANSCMRLILLVKQVTSL